MRSDAVPRGNRVAGVARASVEDTYKQPILKCRPGFFQDDVGKNLLICVKAGLFERVHTVKAQGKGERS
jgi:hypothetical protein